MISNQDDEFVAVRVQDPRIQNEGSWNSYVDYKIFLHTNSKAFTAKTSCVRRRYSEFVWLKKKLQKNAGLVPVPDLPGRSFFSFSNEDFLEGRRKGLQAFLDKVVHMTVCLSDSQLHLFLQTQLPVGHIQDCVQGHTPYSVTDAILTYASSNRGFAQAQEDDAIKEPSLTISYESMESPAPHQPCPQTTQDTFSPELVSCSDPDPLDGLLQLCDQVKSQRKERSSVRVIQRSNHLEAVVEDRSPAEATFYLGDSRDDPDSLCPAEETQQRSCQIQTPVEVHSPMGTGFEVNCGEDGVLEEACSAREESVAMLDTEATTVVHPDSEEEEANVESNSEPEKCANSVAILDLQDSGDGRQEDVCSERPVVENHVISEVNGLECCGGAEGHVADVICPEEEENSGEEKEKRNIKIAESERKEEMPLESDTREETLNVRSDVAVQQMDREQVEQEVEWTRTKDESDEDSRSLPSSNESIVKVSDEEIVCDETEEPAWAANGYLKASSEEVALWSEVEATGRNILDLHMNGCTVEKEDLRYMTETGDSSKPPLDLHPAVAGEDLTENSDFSILETSCTPGLADRKCPEQETLSSLSLDASEEAHEVEVH